MEGFAAGAVVVEVALACDSSFVGVVVGLGFERPSLKDVALFLVVVDSVVVS